MKNTRVAQVSVALSSRYGLPALNYGNWRELILFGGIGMDLPTFKALADAAVLQGDVEATVYELESFKIEFSPIPICLDFESFNQLKANTACLFEVAVLPRSRRWVALLTDDLETFVYGPLDFLSGVSRGAPEGMQRFGAQGGFTYG
jgi:hypothetical protein